MIHQATPPRSAVPLYIGNLTPDAPGTETFGRLAALAQIPDVEHLPADCRALLDAVDAARLVWQLTWVGEAVAVTVREPSGVLRRMAWLDGVQNHGPGAAEFAARFPARPHAAA